MTKRLYMALLLLTLCLVPALNTGCATTQSAAQASADDKIYEYRTVLRQQREHPLAAEVGRELDQVDIWLNRAERAASADGGEERELLELQLETIEGQLVQVRSYYARREAELGLERSRSAYETKMNQIQSERAVNDATRTPLDTGGNP